MRRPGQMEGHAGHALDFGARVDHRVHGAFFRARAGDAARRAVVHAAGQLTDDDHVRAIHQVVLERRGIEQRLVRSHRPQVGIDA